MNPGESRRQETGDKSRIFATLASLGILTALVVGIALVSTGCGKPPKLNESDETDTRQKSDPWEAAAKRLRKETDLKACKAVLGSLNHELSTGEKGEKAAALAKPEEDALASLVPLHASDREEIRPATYSPHDPVYLAECLYLRDAARSLAISGISPEQLADLGFAWVCRQVVLEPWTVDYRPGVLIGTALPPTQILRRGSGSGLERMYVFLALLQQMGLDGCLLGPPGAANTPAGDVAYAPDKKTVLTGTPRGPFWAVGVRIEKDKQVDVKLYDPWRGTAFPATLNQLRANPDSHKAWFDDPAAVSGMTAGDSKGASVCLAVPVNSLSPRMALLEKKLKELVEVKLAIKPNELRDRFPDPKPTFWNPAGDQFAYGRVARTFLPKDQGGDADRYDPGNRRYYDLYIRSQLPPAERVVPADLLRNQAVIADIKERIEERVKVVYLTAFLQPPTPRELVQRGQFREASGTLVQRVDEFAKSLLRVRNTEDADKKMREWAERATELYQSLGTDPNARAAIDENWASQGAALVFDRAVGEVGQAEATLLLALCRHEQAERVQARLEHATGADVDKLRQAAADAWDTAFREWSGYREQFSGTDTASPARAQHIRALADRAKELAGKR
jgi:hypothetical protein